MIREAKAVRYGDYCVRCPLNSPEDVRNYSEAFLPYVEQEIKSVAANAGVPLEISRDQMLSGGVLSKQTDECVCIAHPVKKSSFFKFCIRVRVSESDGFAYVETFQYGTSKSHKMDEMMERSRYKQDQKQERTSYGLVMIQNSVDGALARGVMKAIKGSNKKQDDEDQWYSDVLSVIGKALKLG